MYIRSIKVSKLENVDNHVIDLSLDYPHLVLTGPNGSGKSRILNSLNILLSKMVSKSPPNERDLVHDLNLYQNALKNLNDTPQNINSYKNQVLRIESEIKTLKYPITIDWYDYNYVYEKVVSNDFIFVNLPAHRMTNFKRNDNIRKFNYLKEFSGSTMKKNEEFLTYLLSLKQQKSFAKSEKNIESPNIDEFFDKLQRAFRELFDIEDLELLFIYEELVFKFKSRDKLFSFHQLSDGYSACIDIFTEILSRQIPDMKKTFIFEQPGIVMIDEIETHLHLELQKSILPILMRLFPKIQFILSTHSPFVINSTQNIVVYDLQKKLQLTNLYAYSYERIVENFYNLNLHNIELNQELDMLNELLNKSIISKTDYELVNAYFERFQSIDFNDENLEEKLKLAKIKKGILNNV